VAAMADQAWYMQHRGRQALLARGLDEQQIFALGTNQGTNLASNLGSNPDTPPAEAVALAFTHKLTVDPQAMTDADIESLLVHFTPHQVAEIVYHVGVAAFLDRLTEAAGLGWSEMQP